MSSILDIGLFETEHCIIRIFEYDEKCGMRKKDFFYDHGAEI
ncbi:MAG: hypothetical protein ACW972_05560 [Promethearchaeota archaeon]